MSPSVQPGWPHGWLVAAAHVSHRCRMVRHRREPRGSAAIGFLLAGWGGRAIRGQLYSICGSGRNDVWLCGDDVGVELVVGDGGPSFATCLDTVGVTAW